MPSLEYSRRVVNHTIDSTSVKLYTVTTSQVDMLFDGDSKNEPFLQTRS